MTKIYAIYGYTVVNIRIPAGNGKAFINAEFTKGCPNGGANYRPATYVSTSETEQRIIENSPYFGGKIKLYRTYGAEETVTAAAPRVEEKPVVDEVVPTEYPEVTDMDGVISVLKKRGAKATTLKSEDNMRKYCAVKGISFPNFEF